MSLETFKKLENALPGLKSISLHCNGEPLVNRDIIEILSFARKTNPRLDISFSTNGMLLNPALSAHLLREGLDGISISLDGARKQTYEKIRRGACFEKVIENISDFIEQKKKIGNRIRKIGITAVASKENVHELPDILELAHRLGANYFKVNGLVPHKRELAEQILYNDTYQQVNSEYKRIFEGLEKKAREYRMDIVLPSLRFSPVDYCELNSCLVNWNGDVSPCYLLSYERPYYYFNQYEQYPRIVFGNILTADLFDVWNTVEYASFRKNLSLGKIPGYCEKCFLQGCVL